MARYCRYDLLAIDELGYVPLDAHSAELLFQILTERGERVGGHCDQRTVQRMVQDLHRQAPRRGLVIDRITYRAHIIQTGTTSYRLTQPLGSTRQLGPPDQTSTPGPDQAVELT